MKEVVNAEVRRLVPEDGDRCHVFHNKPVLGTYRTVSPRLIVKHHFKKTSVGLSLVQPPLA